MVSWNKTVFLVVLSCIGNGFNGFKTEIDVGALQDFHMVFIWTSYGIQLTVKGFNKAIYLESIFK